MTSGIIFSDISDHLPIFTFFCQSHTNNICNINHTPPIINTQTKEKFKSALANCNWESVLCSVDPDVAYQNVLSIYNRTYEKCFPLKILSRRKARLFNKPWITKGLQKSIKTKSKLYKLFLQNPSFENDSKYKKYRNKLHHLLKLSKKNYYDCKFERAKGNIKQTWNLLNEIINKRKTRSRIPTSCSHNNIEIQDPIKIANKFCEYFTNIGSSLKLVNCPNRRFLVPHFLKTKILKRYF